MGIDLGVIGSYVCITFLVSATIPVVCLTGIWARRYTRGFEELRGAQFFRWARAARKF